MSLKAVVHDFGKASEVVTLEEASFEALPPDHVRLKMLVSAINASDLISISGAYRSRIPLPFFPGYEGVGTVSEVGSNCTTLQIGQRVIPYGQSGVWRNEMIIAENRCLVVPDDLTNEEAATSYINPMTAYIMLREHADPHTSSTIAINAAGSAIGGMLVRLALQTGITLIAFFRSSRAAANLENLPIKCIRYYDSADLSRICRDWSTKKVDVLFDCVGGEEAISFSQIIASHGRLIHYGLLSNTAIPLNRWSRPDVAIKMFHLRDWIHGSQVEAIREIYEEVVKSILSGHLKTTVQARFEFEQIRSALVKAESFSSSGKILLYLEPKIEKVLISVKPGRTPEELLS